MQNQGIKQDQGPGERRAASSPAPLLEVDDLRCYFHTRDGVVRAVDGVSFSLRRGEAIGIVGESGSGKSVTCYSLLGLVPRPPARIESGTAMFGGIDLLRASERTLRGIRGRRIGIIFQDPMTSLNPYMRISDQLVEPLALHTKISRRAALERAVHALEEAGIRDAGDRIRHYPHQFSGGMRQRVMIAMAMINDPEILIADEPTTALDVTIQAQILELIRERRERLGTAVIFITHDLAVVSQVCGFVHVMYAGQFLESARTDVLFERPAHAYTKALQASIPALHSKSDTLYTIPGRPPSLIDPPAGCRFRPRRPEPARKQCLQHGTPDTIELEPDHWVQACPGCVESLCASAP